MINVVAKFAVVSGSEQTFEDTISEFRGKYMADPGCLRFDLQKHAKAEGAYVLLETYDSGDALRRHGESDDYREFSARMKDLLAQKPEVDILRPVGEQA